MAQLGAKQQEAKAPATDRESKQSKHAAEESLEQALIYRVDTLIAKGDQRLEGRRPSEAACSTPTRWRVRKTPA